MNSNRRGFTLVEIIMVIVIVSIISVVLANYLFSLTRGWHFLSGQRRMVIEADAALTSMTKDIRRIQAGSSISTFTPTQITFVDIDSVPITYNQSGASLLRSGAVVLNNLQTLAISYLKGDGTTALVNSEIVLVRVRLTTVSGSNKFVCESSSRVRPRSL